jgi:hypothetical protein
MSRETFGARHVRRAAMNLGAMIATFACAGFALGAGCSALMIKNTRWMDWLCAGLLLAIVGLAIAPFVIVFSCGLERGCCGEGSFLCVLEKLWS